MSCSVSSTSTSTKIHHPPGPPRPIVVVKRSADETPERPLRVRVARQRSRSCDQLPREDLGAYFLAENQQIPVRGKVRGAL